MLRPSETENEKNAVNYWSVFLENFLIFNFLENLEMAKRNWKNKSS